MDVWKKVWAWIGAIGALLLGVLGFILGRRGAHGRRVGGNSGGSTGDSTGEQELGNRAREHEEAAGRAGAELDDSIGRATDANRDIGESAQKLQDIIDRVNSRNK